MARIRQYHANVDKDQLAARVDKKQWAIKIESSDSEELGGVRDERPVRQPRTPAVRLIPRTCAEQGPRRLTQSTPIRPASIFVPQDSQLAPEQHFTLQTVSSRTRFPRFINRFDSKEMMIVVNGSCLSNGAGVDRSAPAKPAGKPRAGLSFIYKEHASYVVGENATTMPLKAAGVNGESGAALVGDRKVSIPDITGKIALPLEQRGPRCDIQTHTSCRAKLRAVIAALDFRPWYVEGWQRIVILTDLEYVATGATAWLPVWTQRRWRGKPHLTKQKFWRSGKKIANRDLWEELQDRVDKLRANGTEVAFWLATPKSVMGQKSRLIQEAKKAAKDAASCHTGSELAEFTKLCGIFA